jgi:hypothetical protein
MIAAPDCNSSMAVLITVTLIMLTALVAVEHFNCELAKVKPIMNAARADTRIQQLHRAMQFQHKPGRT